MISIVRILDATKEFIKVLRFGKSDVQTCDNVLPFGIDSKPIKDMQAVHSTTQNTEQNVILGYLLKSDKTDKGEIRVYSVDNQGIEKFFIMLYNDGTCEIGGDVDNFIRFSKLNDSLQNFIADLNTKLTTALTAVGGSWPGTSLDISDSKIDEIKTL